MQTLFADRISDMLKTVYPNKTPFCGRGRYKYLVWVTLDQGQWMTFDIHIGSCTHLVNFINQLWYHIQVSEKSLVLPFSHTKA